MALPVVIIAFQQAVTRLAQYKLVKDMGYNLIIAGLIEVITGEMDAIKALDAKVQALVDEPFRTGLDQLRRAAASNRKEVSLEKAYDSFLRAKNIYRPLLPIHSARSAVYCGSCSEMLGEQRNALVLYEEGYKVFYERHSQIQDELDWLLSRTGRSQQVLDWIDNNISAKFNKGTCNEFTPQRYTRRTLLETIAKPRKRVASEGESDKNILRRLDEVFEQIRPVASLLRARQSKLSELRDPREFTWEYDAELTIRKIETKCGFKFRD